MSDDDEVFWDCYLCSGERGCPRASKGSPRCSAAECKKRQTAERAAAKMAPVALRPPPDPTMCFKVKEVLGMSMCMQLTPEERRCGKEVDDDEICYQVRGKFGKHKREDIDDMVPDTRWVTLSELVDNIKEGDLKQLDAAVDDLKRVANAARKRLRKGSR